MFRMAWVLGLRTATRHACRARQHRACAVQAWSTGQGQPACAGGQHCYALFDYRMSGESGVSIEGGRAWPGVAGRLDPRRTP